MAKTKTDSIVITAVRNLRKSIRIEYMQGTDEYALNCHDNPLPGFYKALTNLNAHVCALCEFPAKDADKIEATGITVRTHREKLSRRINMAPSQPRSPPMDSRAPIGGPQAGLAQVKGWTSQAVLGTEPESVARTNRGNDGRTFQKEIELTASAYHQRREAVLRKADPPVAVLWPFNKATGRKEQRVIFKANPWLDFVGSWTAHGGRMLLVEAKSTATHRLPFNRHGGLTAEQVASMKTWRLAGAAVCVVWQWAGRVCLWTPEMVMAAEARADKSLVFESGIAVPRGEGNLIWDFLPVLASLSERRIE